MFTDDTLLKTLFFTIDLNKLIMTFFIGSDLTMLYDQIHNSNSNSIRKLERYVFHIIVRETE